ncbi:MAG: choice-of-anchor D domain-containing protein, partial [Candidatus Neomarinimicrobiota bacterium]|nr:choice-of-anchor D domain-containing protein [Candidatus Neomarinimicrobiota bacterium]
SNIEGGQDSIATNDNGTVTWGDGNVDIDPLFVDVDNDDYHLLASSQCINGGDPTTFDSDGSRADMGAHYYHNEYSGPTWYIAESGNDTTATGASDDPFRSIQSGINFSSDADSVTVAAGTYVENINFRGRNIKVAGEDRETTIIDGNQSGSVVIIEQIPTLNPSLSELTLTNGISTTGGGLQIVDANVFLTNIKITNCTTTGEGSAIYSNSNNPTTVTLKNSILTENTSPGNNSTIKMGSTDLIIISSDISDNISGGGVIFQGSYESLHISNSTIMNNANGFGVDISSGSGVNTIVNSVISGNWSPGYDSGEQIRILWESILSVDYSNIDGGQSSVIMDEGEPTLTWGSGNLDVDPMFVDTANGDYHLLADSRLIDAGHPDSTDGDGTIADMGAYYYDQAGQPIRVTNLITTPSANNVSVKWNANSDAGSYNVYRSTDGSADFYSLSPYTTASDTSYVDETAADNTTYHYRVSAVDSESDEGILAFADHGRTGADSTALYMPDVYLSRTLPADLDPGTSFTLEGFFRLLMTPVEERSFIFLEPEISVSMSPDEAGILLRLNHDSVSYDGIVITDTSWHHLALTTDGSAAILWVDGYAAAQSVVGFSVNGRSLKLGNGGSSAQTIELDEARLSSVVRYGAGFIPAALTDDENTLGYWRFNEASFDADVPTVYDLSGSGLHLALGGSGEASWSADVPARTDMENALVINEIMPNPAGSDGGKEWFELYNQWFTPLHLQGWSISGEGDNESHTLESDLVIGMDEYTLFGQSADSASNGGYVPDYVYGTTVSLSNFGELLSLKEGNDVVVDGVDFDDSFQFASGVSMELIRPDYDNSDSSSWQSAGLPYGGEGNLGTPGERNAAFSGTIVLNTPSLDYGYVTEGTESGLGLWISNEGVSDLTISSIASQTEFFSLSPNQVTIAPGDSVQVSITFSPETVETYLDTVTILSDDPYSPLNTVALAGSGINEFADIVVEGDGSDSLFSYQFPFTRLGFSRTLQLSVVNIGTPNLEIEEIILEGDPVFSIDTDAAILSFMDTLLVSVVYTPTEAGRDSSILTFGSNDPDESTYTLALSGQAAENIILYVPSEYPTISAAIDSAFQQDTIEVATGTYEESVTLLDKNLVFRGSGRANETILQGDGTGPVLTVSGGQNSTTVISHFMIIGGGGTQGGGIKIDGSSTPVLHHLILSSNAVSGNGGGIAIMSGGADLSFTSISNNTAGGSGGALYAAASASVVLNHSILWDNGNTEIGSFGNVAVSYSIVGGGADGTGNLDLDPLFVNGPGLDLSF